MKSEVRLPSVERLACGQGGNPGHGLRLPHREVILAVELRSFEERVPVKTGGTAGKISPRPVIVALENVLGVLAAAVRGRDSVLQIKDPRRFCVRVGDVSKIQDM